VRLNNILEESVFNIPLVPSRRSVIAVGTLSLAKGLRALLPVITISPRVHFEFVGEVLDNEGASVARELRQLPNVTLTGPLGRRETLERIAAAKALVNTSPHEGFPNTFLEAWALGTPVISLYVDPGGVIRRNHLGYVCDGNIQLFQELVQRESYDLDPSSIRTYVASHHSPESAFRVLEPLVSNGREDNGMKTPGQTNNNE
jgi:glycosyltransferase involved in cell wall biosynthesis